MQWYIPWHRELEKSMERSQFMKELRGHLWLRLSRQEIKEVLNHYNQKFDHSENESEAIQSLGDLKELAKGLLAPHNYIERLKLKVGLLTVLWFFAFSYAYVGVDLVGVIAPIGIALLFLLQQLILGNPCMGSIDTIRKEDRRLAFQMILGSSILTVFLLTILLVLYHLPYEYELIYRLGIFDIQCIFLLIGYGLGIASFRCGRVLLPYVIGNLFIVHFLISYMNVYADADLAGLLQSRLINDYIIRDTLLFTIFIMSYFIVQQIRHAKNTK